FLTAQLDRILSASHEPRPRCPRRGGGHIDSAGFRMRPIGRLPMFECRTCRRYFSRTADTPLGEKHLKKLDLFVSLLSQPISCTDAGGRLGSRRTTSANVLLHGARGCCSSTRPASGSAV
ncbi:hypothetical protein LGM48_28990, partial [Burkholderia multivorans]|nr:hypothetical protein [Burkholderia multivorans]